jgi:hypothetical protein
LSTCSFLKRGEYISSLCRSFFYTKTTKTREDQTMSLEHEDERKRREYQGRNERKGRIYCLTEWQLLSKLVLRLHHLIIVIELRYVSLGLDSHNCLCIRHVSRHRMNDRKEHCLLWHETPD